MRGLVHIGDVELDFTNCLVVFVDDHEEDGKPFERLDYKYYNQKVNVDVRSQEITDERHGFYNVRLAFTVLVLVLKHHQNPWDVACIKY